MKTRLAVTVAAFSVCLLAADTSSSSALKSLQGKWKMVACEADGKKSKLTDEEIRSVKLLIKMHQFTVEFPPGDVFGSNVATRQEFKFSLREPKSPRSPGMIDLTITSKGNGKKALGIYEVKGKRLRICRCEDGKTRPSEFATAPASGSVLAVYERE